jgi:hypothetical protein
MLCGDRRSWRVAGAVASVSVDDFHPRFGEDLGAHLAALLGPFVGLFSEYGTDQPDDGGPVGEDADHVGTAADLLVQTLRSPVLV